MLSGAENTDSSHCTFGGGALQGCAHLDYRGHSKKGSVCAVPTTSEFSTPAQAAIMTQFKGLQRVSSYVTLSAGISGQGNIGSLLSCCLERSPLRLRYEFRGRVKLE